MYFVKLNADGLQCMWHQISKEDAETEHWSDAGNSVEELKVHHGFKHIMTVLDGTFEMPS